MNTAIAMDNINFVRDALLNLSVFSYKNSIEKVYEKDALLDELRNDIGDNLFYTLSDEDKQFILDTEGSVDFGYKADESDLKRIFSSIKNEYQY